MSVGTRYKEILIPNVVTAVYANATNGNTMFIPIWNLFKID